MVGGILYNGKSTTLLQHIINHYNFDTTNVSYHLKTINEFTYYSVAKQDKHIEITLLQFYYSIFSSIRKAHNKKLPIEYPDDLYEMVFHPNFDFANSENKKLFAIEHRAVSGVWLYGEDLEHVIISAKTFGWIWRNLTVICEKEKLIRMYWANASQYFDFRLQNIAQNYNFETSTVTNTSELLQRETERHNFLELHHALGGLLLYKKQYKILKYIFTYSQSLPPRYALLPETMGEIFKWFQIFSDDYGSDIPFDSKYYFPELDNLGNRQQVNYWICSYISLLFIRQYSLQQYYVFNNLQFTSFTFDILELNKWVNIPYFDICLAEIISNGNLLAEVNFDILVESKRKEFKDFLSNLKVAIENKIGSEKLNAELSPQKIKLFNNSTDKIIIDAFEEYLQLFIKKSSSELKNKQSVVITGGRTLFSKSAFTEGDIPHFNFDTVLASQIVDEIIKTRIPDSFFKSRTQRYLLNRNKIFEALNKIIGTNKELVLLGINVGDDLKNILNQYSKSSIFIPSRVYRSIDTLFVLKKSDLPSIIFEEPEEQEKYQLKPINSDYKIYTSVIDINTEENKTLKEGWIKSDSQYPDLKVLVTIAFKAIMYWNEKKKPCSNKLGNTI